MHTNRLRFATLYCTVYFTTPWAQAQNARNQRQFNNPHGWDIRLAVPGQPGNDYPTLNSIPRTSFTCSGKEPGYYADMETNCQVFRVCTLGSTFGFQSFVCPNGTLFNQQVFVCDWWMNVKCQKSKEHFNNNNDKFGNLKLGSQFMADIKKMIMHPASNPFDRSKVKSNLIYMQVYKPPSGQLYNEALIRNLEKNTNDIFIKKKQAQKSYQGISNTDYTAAASTPTTQYIPNYVFQNQIQKKPVSIPSNAHGGQISQSYQDFQSFNNKKTISSPSSQYGNAHLPVYNSLINKNRQAIFEVGFSKEIDHKANKETLLHPNGQTQTRFSKDNLGRVESETKQNLVSKETPPKLITKTLAYRKIIKDSKSGTPKSRITFKTWIVRPSKSAKLTEDTVPYTYNNPEKISTKPSIEPEKISRISKTELDNTNDISNKYDTPTTNLIVPPTTPQSILSTFVPKTEALTFLTPTTFNPLSYLPPDSSAKQISRQYLLPDIYNNKIQLVAAGSSPTPFYKLPLIKVKEEPKFSLTKQSHINSNSNNLSFTDILTKEKLDVSVSNIVKDTNNVLLNASPENIVHGEEQSIDYPAENYLPPESSSNSGELLTLQPPSPLPQSSRLISTPSTNLEPPIEHNLSLNMASNKFTNLPYIKESLLPPNTIERMVSLRITLPENIAKYLFKDRYSNDTRNLEILNTENSNYLVLTNRLIDNSRAKFIPIGKLSTNNSLSDSQDLVFSFLADSINAAKQYSNIAQQNILSPTPTQPQFQNLKNEKLQQISQDISQLTSSQYSATSSLGYYNPSDTVITSAARPSYKTNSKNNTSLPPNVQTQAPRKNNLPTSHEETQEQSYLSDSNKIYSGQMYQLPVPVVTRQFYNSPVPSISNYILSSNFLPANDQTDNQSNKLQQFNPDVEIIPSQIIPTDSYQTIINQNVLDQGSAANVYIDDFRIPTNGIRAQVQDNIIGTIPHPSEEDKLIKYKKDNSYYIYTHSNNDYNGNSYEVNNKIRNEINTNQKNENLRNQDPLTFQLVPSLGYKLEDEKEQYNFLKLFHIDNLDRSKQNIKRRQDIISDIDFAINHPKTASMNSKILSALYDGPSSYSAPQASVGNLQIKQDTTTSGSSNSSTEKIYNFDNSNGYPRIIPLKKFLF